MKSKEDGNSLESFDLVFAVNVRAVYRLIQLAAPYLEKTKGNVVNVGSGLSEKTHPVYMPYSISKAAVNHLTRNFANSLSPKGIRVNCASPGLTLTDFVSRHGIPEQKAHEMFNTLAKEATLLGRAATADEQADLILYLAAPTTTYITGSIVFNEGGILSKSHANAGHFKTQ
uniref:Uncharacterized protein n=1 Tax=Panagrolaimus sp. JU765 TaxID=591449 RepID=A0AC34QH48_9BILA